VALAWQKRCYGRSDPGLSRAGRTIIAPLVDRLAALRPDHVLHSDMRRSRAVAEPLARRLGIVPLASPLWRERDFGSWEGQGWALIHRATGNAMDGMIDAPASFRPGGNGETTQQLAARITLALAGLPQSGTVVVIAHGGPIAVARMLAGNRTWRDLPGLIIAAGDIHVLPRTGWLPPPRGASSFAAPRTSEEWVTRP
jgi:broad specificity phosphatase PhoE